ncbi:hypothetical protein J6590_033811 [Homalodisca vitripennis]|nr:hypothetical protein J6590_033811 [Homalodisca vitripennis]
MGRGHESVKGRGVLYSEVQLVLWSDARVHHVTFTFLLTELRTTKMKVELLTFSVPYLIAFGSLGDLIQSRDYYTSGRFLPTSGHELYPISQANPQFSSSQPLSSHQTSVVTGCYHYQ